MIFWKIEIFPHFIEDLSILRIRWGSVDFNAHKSMIVYILIKLFTFILQHSTLKKLSFEYLYIYFGWTDQFLWSLPGKTQNFHVFSLIFYHISKFLYHQQKRARHTGPDTRLQFFCRKSTNNFANCLTVLQFYGKTVSEIKNLAVFPFPECQRYWLTF